MKQLLEVLKSARRIELLIITAVLSIALVLALQTQQPSLASDTERRLERILAQIEGAGKVSVMLAEQEDGYLGCVVAAQGSDIQTMLQMQRAVQALTALELGRIEIVQADR